MRFKILQENVGRMRFHVYQSRMSYAQADTLLYFLQRQSNITYAKVYDRTCDAVIQYNGSREDIIKSLRRFDYEQVDVPEDLIANSARALNNRYQEKLVDRLALRCISKYLIPYPIRLTYIFCKSVAYIIKGLKCLARGKIEVPVLDAITIGVSLARNDISTASSIMFMLGVGELLEEWTHKKSIADLAMTMSLNVDQVWLNTEQGQFLVDLNQIKQGDEIIVHMGNIVPFDGIVSDGEAMVNQSSLTGEAIPVRKTIGGYVYAGTILEEGELTIKVKSAGGTSRYEKIVSMIEQTEKLKSAVEGKAEHLADELVPYSLMGTALTWLLSRNITKALSVLMVDYSCALKLAMPVSVLSAIREAGTYNITVKGGKFLEAVAQADTIVLDKTGTLTKAQPTVVDVISFNDQHPDELLRIAACLEEHFPHSMAKAVVEKAREKQLIHEEMHSKVEYIVAHGIVSQIENKRVIIGSDHFVFDDEKCQIPADKQKLFEELPNEYSQLYMAIDGKLVAVICIEDPLKDEALSVVEMLRRSGLKVVMMTGDSDRTARMVASSIGVDEYYAEVLPEDKANYIQQEKLLGRKVIMVGDGINDSPALSAADVGIAMSDGAQIAREVADITIRDEDLYQLVILRKLSGGLMKKIHKNYRMIIGFNSILIFLGIGGIIQPATSALLHNSSTLLIGMNGMTNLLDK